MIGSVYQHNTAETLVFGPIILASDHITGATGVSLTVTISKNGGAFATPIGGVTEIGNGFYAIAANALDASAVGVLIVHAVGAGCDPYDDWYDVVDAATSTTVIPSPASTLSTVNVSGRSAIAMALKILGVLAAGETPEAEDEADAFTLANGLLDSLGTQRLSIYTSARSTYTWAANAASKTLGASGADFTLQRPVSIDRAAFIPTGTVPEIELNVFPGMNIYSRIPDKTTTSAIPGSLYIEQTHPLLILRLYPIPSAAGTLVLYTPTALTQFANYTTVYTLPNGYARMLYYNIAKECIPIFAVPPSRIPMVLKIADESLADIKRQNVEIPELTREWRPYSIYTDSY